MGYSHVADITGLSSFL